MPRIRTRTLEKTRTWEINDCLWNYSERQAEPHWNIPDKIILRKWTTKSFIQTLKYCCKNRDYHGHTAWWGGDFAPSHSIFPWGCTSKHPSRCSRAATATQETQVMADQKKHETVTAESPKIPKNRMKRWPRKLLKVPFIGLTPCKAPGQEGASLKPAVPKHSVTPSLNLGTISSFFRCPAVAYNCQATKIWVYTWVINLFPSLQFIFHCTLLVPYFLFATLYNYGSTYAEKSNLDYQ